jgi:branched-chain amino acid transport system permease protein
MQRFIFGGLLILFALYRSQGLLPAKQPTFDLKELKEEAEEEEIQPVISTAEKNVNL